MTGTLVPRYSFETFTLGPHYRFAHAAAVAVAEAPGTACNPLFIYGGLRLGRTHLLHAIGNYAQELHPSLDIRYVRAAEFGRQFAIAAGDGQHDDLRSRYLDAGMLLVDDVQLLPDAGAIQAEFLHVFTALHNDGRQLVISADRAPRLLAGLDDSLRDRLERGLAVELANDTDGDLSAHARRGQSFVRRAISRPWRSPRLSPPLAQVSRAGSPWLALARPRPQ